MKSLKKILLLLFLFSYQINLIKAQDSTASKQALTFENAMNLALQNSHSIKQLNYLKKEKEQDAKAMNSYFFPKIGLTGSYMVMEKDITLDLNPIKDAITPLYNTLGNYGVFSSVQNPDPATHAFMPILPDSLSTKAVRNQLKDGANKLNQSDWDQTIQKKQFGVVATTLNWPIFTGGKISAGRKATKIEIKEADEQTKQKEAELLSEVVERYYGLCFAKQLVNVRNDVNKGVHNHLQDATKMSEQGLIAKADVMHAKVYQAQSQRELSQSQHMVETLNQSLLCTLALDSNENIIPISNLFYLENVEPLSYFKAQAKENSPIIKMIESKKSLADQKYKSEKSEFFPSIAIQGEYTILNKDLSPYAPKWVAGVGLTWTIFDGTSRYHKTKAAMLKIKQADEAQQKASNDIETIIDKYYNELMMYSEQINALDTARGYAEEYLRLRQKEFHEEMTNSTEVIDAQLSLSKISIERLQAMYGYDMTLAKLLQYAGIPDKFKDYQSRKDSKTDMYKPINEK